MGWLDYFISEEKKDFRAAEADFIKILELMKIKSSRKQLVIFTENFNLSYNSVEITLKERAQSVFNATKAARINFTFQVIENLNIASHVLEGTNKSNIGENVGRSLGTLVATIDNGLLGKYFDPYSLEEETRTIGRKIEGYMKKIHSLDKRIYLGNIAMRVWRLSENRKNNSWYNLSPSFISEINSALSSHYN